MRRVLFALMVALIGLNLSAQTRTIHGTILDAADNEPLVGATIQPIGGGQGTSANVDGHFTLQVPAHVKKATVSYVGYESQTVDLKDSMTVHLVKGIESLDEVIVVAYGTAKRSAYTGSASVVDAATIEDRLVTNITNALTGAVAGVQTLSSNGQPGVGATVRIRGVGSINASSSPLYVLDGVPYEGDIAALNTADVESLTVLKDAAAAALYGARGANGVILITTKRGKQGEAKVTFDAKWGANSRQTSFYDMIEGTENYLKLAYQSLYNGGIYGLGYTPEAAHDYANSKIFSALGYQCYTLPEGEGLFTVGGGINPNATLGYSDGTYYYTPDDWLKGTIRNGMRQEYNLSVSGGTERLNYYINGSYMKDEGLIYGSAYERLSTRTSLDYKVNDWMRVSTNISYSNAKSDYPGDQTTSNSSGNAFLMAYAIAPYYPMYVRHADGTIMYNEAYGHPVYDYGDGYSSGSVRNWMTVANEVGSLLYNTSQYLTDLFNGKWTIELTPVAGLTLTGNAALTLDHTRTHWVLNPLYGSFASQGGWAEQANDRYRMTTIQGLADYRKTFNQKHTFDLLLGYESYSYNCEYVGASGTNPYNPLSWSVDNTLDNDNRSGWGSADDYATRGIFARLNYDLDNRYFFSGSFRRDGSSRFAKNHRWGNFFSLSAAWDIAREDFMESTNSWLNQLKLRASFGQQGNDGIGGWYAYSDQYTIQGSTEWSDAKLAYKGNEDLTWETSNNFNIGLDFTLWNNKLYGNIEYFSRQTSDMLYYKPVASSLGYSSIPMNVGSMRNYGAELELTYNAIHTKDWNWTINLNATVIRNKIIKLAEDLNGYWISGSNIYVEGESMYQYYMVKYAGVDPTTGKPLYWAFDFQKDDDGNYILDAKGNKIKEKGSDYVTDTYNSEYRQKLGNSLPPVYGGFGTNVSWKGIDFGVQFSYQLGGRVYDSGYMTYINSGTSTSFGQNWHKDMLRAWTPENPNTDIPRLNYLEGTNYLSSTDFAMTNASYLALNNLTLGYTLPSAWTKKLQMESVRIYGTADNVALWSARKGLDPRQGYWSSNAVTYTTMRCITGGIKVVF